MVLEGHKVFFCVFYIYLFRHLIPTGSQLYKDLSEENLVSLSNAEAEPQAREQTGTFFFIPPNKQ